jgi:hypothetical protein
MPLFQYFGWVGSFLLAALFAAGWWLPGNVADAPRPRTPLSESIQIRIRSDHKWPERVVFDTTGSELAPAKSAQAQTGPQDQRARGGERRYCPQSVSQAARKKLTRSRTNLGTSF